MEQKCPYLMVPEVYYLHKVRKQCNNDSYTPRHRKAEGVIVTQGTPQWYPGNLNPMCTLVMQNVSLSPKVLPNVPRQSQSYMYIKNAVLGRCHTRYSQCTQASQSYMYINNAVLGRCHTRYSPMVPRQSQSYMYISNALALWSILAERSSALDSSSGVVSSNPGLAGRGACVLEQDT